MYALGAIVGFILGVFLTILIIMILEMFWTG